METQQLIFSFVKKRKEDSSEIPVNFLKSESMRKIEEYKVFVDGAARGNPGPAGAGIHIICSDSEIKGSFFLGEKTNNQAEYLALILALYLVKQKQSDFNSVSLVIYSDSELLVRQLNGIYKIKNPILLKLNNIVVQVLCTVSHKFVHVLRDKNKIADKLANEGIDKKKKIPTNFMNFLANFNDIKVIIELLKK
jgi:ribonuclease HI